MFDRVALQVTKPAVDYLARQIYKAGYTADQVTLAAFASGMFSVLLILLGHSLLALIPLLLGRLLDGLDGAVARLTNKQTDRGAFLDITLDFVFYASVPLAFVIADPTRNALAGAVLLAAFVTTGTSFLAYAAIAAKRGETSAEYPSKGIYYLGGLTEGSETIALFLAMCIWPSAFAILAYVYSALCALTTATRIWAGWVKFGARG
jgi:phosphatidylglycerophosphate synthase